MRSVALACLIVLGCSRQHAEPRKEQAPPSPTAPAAAASALAPAPVALEPEAAPACHPEDVAPSKLARSWPTLLGRQVRIACRVERMVDMTDAIVIADKERFVVMMAQSDSWDGVKTRVFTVMGSRTVRLKGGGVTLPELVATERCQ